MSYYAELRDGSYHACFEFETQELLNEWIKLQNEKTAEKNEQMLLQRQEWQKNFDQVLERVAHNEVLVDFMARTAAIPHAELDDKEFVPLTFDEALEKYPIENNKGEIIVRSRHKIYSLEDLW